MVRAALLVALVGAIRPLPAVDAAGAPGAPFFPPLARPPLDPPLAITGGFGEYRVGHFHAGLDLGTGGHVGKPVYAPLSGQVERVRASGVGYGRSIYIRARDGRLIQLGHLDAFEEPLAGFVSAAQESTGQYEQDLWPEPSRFPVRVGQRVAWSGESGAGGPHLHIEIRRGDMAMNPLRAGLAAPDTRPPTLTRLTLEPLDDTSYVERGAAPYAVSPGARAETLLVEGRVRAVVGARDGTWRGVDRMVPWSVGMEWEGHRVECRFDSVSWATDMPEGDYVYDAGRVVGDRGIVLWAPAGFRPRVIVADAPLDEDAGTLTVRPGDSPRTLRLFARDLAGGVARASVVLRGPRPGERGPDAARAGGLAEPGDDRFRFASLPAGYLRVSYRGAPRRASGVRVMGVRAGPRGGVWTAVVPPESLARSAAPRAEGLDGEQRAWGDTLRGFRADVLPGTALCGGYEFRAAVSDTSLFEPTAWAWDMNGREPAANLEHVPLGRAFAVLPATLPLRAPVAVTASRAGQRRLPPRAGLYRDSGDGWEWIAQAPEGEAFSVAGRSRRLGRFALFADTLGPRIAPPGAPRLAAPGAAKPAPYSRWALEARLTEDGSGVNASATYFQVDGARVPSEWDAEKSTLRWRPHRAPAPGAHRFTVVAHDRAGNVALRSGTFVLD